MNQNAASRGTNWPVLLLVPAVVIIAKAAMHRRAMWESGWAASEAGGRGYGRHRRFGPGERTDDLSAFRLPPKIERVLGAWHTRAHQTADPIVPDDAIASDDAVTA